MAIRRVITALFALAITACADSTATPSSEASYKWMAESNTAELGARITAAPGSRLEIREDAKGGLYFRVVMPGAKAAPEKDLDDTFICPPICR